jgi:ketopantoate reductase
MKILIVGAGAVGMVYGHQLANAGHEITFLVKEKYHAQLEREKETGAVLYYLNKDKALHKPIRYKDFSVISSWDNSESYDLIALAISSTALRQLPLDKLNLHSESKNSPANILMLQPSEEDFDHLTKTINANQILQGMITLISYQTDDINNEVNPAGIAYYLPPLAMPISSPRVSQNDSTESKKQKNARDEVITVFNQSGIKARSVKSALDESRLPSAFFMTFLCALEAANWEFDRLKNSPQLLQQLSEAQRALLPLKISANGLSQTVQKALLMAILKPWLYKVIIRIGPKVVPLPLEAYLKKHFLKVRTQTLLYMQDYHKQYPSKAVANLLGLIN